MMRTLKLLVLLIFSCIFTHSSGQKSSPQSDTDWMKREVFIEGGYEAEYLFRIGDVDNLGFGWPEDFDPFCGRMTQAHYYPWDADRNELPFMDRIMVSSKFNPDKDFSCGQDGYTYAIDQYTKGPAVYKFNIFQLKGKEIKNAWFQIFIDDFQSPTFCSSFRIRLNGKIFAEGEKVLNAIDQTGPVGKLVSMALPEEFFAVLAEGKILEIQIDEINGAGDGFAVDFVRLLVNRKRENNCKGNLKGYVYDKETYEPIRSAQIKSGDGTVVTSDPDGIFLLKDLSTGFEVLTAVAIGYIDGQKGADIGEGDENEEVYIYLEKSGKTVFLNNKTLSAGESIALNNILFDVGKATLRAESFVELDKVVNLLKLNDSMEIELSGHTSSEGYLAINRSLSYQRVNGCKDYILSKGIDSRRIIAVGYGPDRPLVPNDNEANRARNRRVEMRITNL